MMDQLAKDLDIPFRRNGSLVICLSEEDKPKLVELYERGIANGVKELRLLIRKRFLNWNPIFLTM